MTGKVGRHFLVGPVKFVHINNDEPGFYAITERFGVVDLREMKKLEENGFPGIIIKLEPYKS